MGLQEYINEVDEAFKHLILKYNETIALNILSFAVNMRNTDNQGKNIVASMSIKEETANEED